ncbi:Sfh1 protein [Martiniozyma asiatica (nom. inval.)]|nr:Sfh1 protein [Martiniozyma asiatica]
MSTTTSKPLFPQALTTTFQHRLTKNSNALFQNVSTSRAAKRHASRINYAEDYPELDFEDDAGANGNEDDQDANYEDPIAAYDIYKSLWNTSQPNINLQNHLGNREAPKELPEMVFNEEENIANAKQPEKIVPIKVAITTNGVVIKDQFLWNINDQLIQPETFAYIMCQELDVAKNVESQMVTQIRDQIQAFEELFSNPNNQIIDQFLANEKEFHVVLDISVNIGEDFFTDRVEWNLMDSSFTPEMFAETVVSDLGLKKEFETAIAYAVYDEIYKVRRELVENPQQVSQYIDTLPFFNLVHQKADVNDATKLIVQGLRYDRKKHGEEFSPSVEKLSEWEIEKRETEKERNLRRRKRETMRVVIR